MFPQSELDNYKLQVELLQEKLQRSEISRQQLEHKLDKILQKREEHDKILRSKSKHKYHEFLEEQHRRNDRNKQLVQMLERIEQQTIAMNSRSERLKMMKLQYEMYFAKLVHSQTRRCIQSSTIPMMTPMMGTANLPGPISQTMMMPTTAVEGYNYTKVYEEPPFMDNSFQPYADPIITDRERFNRPQRDIMSAKLMEMPMSSEYTLNSDRSNYMDARKSEPYQTQQRPYEPNVTIADMQSRLNLNDSKAERSEPKIATNAPELGGNLPCTGESSLLDKSKQFTDMDIPSTVSSTSEPLTFNRTTNVKPTSNKTNTVKESLENSSVLTEGKDRSNGEKQWGTPRRNTSPKRHQSFEINSITSRDGTVTDLTSSSHVPHDYLIDKSPIQDIYQEKPKTLQEFTPTARRPRIDMNASVKPEVEKVQTMKTAEYKANEMEPKLSTSTIKSITEPEKTITTTATPTPMLTQKPTPVLTQKPTPTPILPQTQTPKPTSVSIEKIENAIYGELVNSPEETHTTLQPDKPTVSPTLLENLVTQSPINNEPNFIPANLAKEEPQQYALDTNIPNYDTTTTPAENIEGAFDRQSYQEMYDYNTTIPSADGETSNNVDYAAYENNSNIVDENQQQQQYDYSNYDPSQYSYPGYIYDETTGEYKPDPNATAEQYATDQQYAQSYEQQYQQQEGYDYSQMYDQQDPQSVAVDPAAYGNYDVTQAQVDQQQQPAAEMVTQQQQQQPQPQQPLEQQQQPQQQQEQPQLEQQQQELQLENPNSEKTSDQQPPGAVETPVKNTKPTSILATKKEQQDKKEAQKNKKRVNFVDSSETDESSVDKGQTKAAVKPNTGNESDFDFSSSSEAGTKKA